MKTLNMKTSNNSCSGRSNAPSFGLVVQQWFFHRMMRGFMLAHNVIMKIAMLVGRLRHSQNGRDGYDLLLTGRFEADNWATAHLKPLAACRHCRVLYVVSTSHVPNIPKVVAIYPPQWLVSLVGRTPARLLVFIWTGFRRRPDIIGGFHLMLNGLTTAVLAPLVGARSLYFCVGGPSEFLDGGIGCESGPFVRMGTPDPIVERRLLRAVGTFQILITMGTKAADFFTSRGINAHCHVVSGGIDAERFHPGELPSVNDVIFVGRLAEVKRIDIFLHAMSRVAETLPEVKACIIGEGVLRHDLEELARNLKLDGNVNFLGFQNNVVDWLKRSKIFILTSNSEGLSLALMEAMMCGVPAVVPQVGDLADLVEEGVNGYLVPNHSPEAFASRILNLLTDPQTLTAFSQAARRSALRYETSSVTRKWDEILGNQALDRKDK
jgi:L-malate glycosyltransferase